MYECVYLVLYLIIIIWNYFLIIWKKGVENGEKIFSLVIKGGDGGCDLVFIFIVYRFIDDVLIVR